MKFNEQTLEDIIYSNAVEIQCGRTTLAERGLEIQGKMFRQVNLDTYGRLDLLTIDDINLEITVYELKEGKIKTDALVQASKYIAGIKHHLLGKNLEDDFEYKIRLIGDSVDKNTGFTFLYNLLPFVDIYTYSFNINGIFFEHINHSWSYTNFTSDVKTQKMLLDAMRYSNEEV